MGRTLLKIYSVFRKLKKLPRGSRFRLGILYVFLNLKAFVMSCRKKSWTKQKLFGFEYEFIRPESFLRQFEYLFIDAEYFFESKKTRPMILDCGASTGLSVFYFKTLFPECHIVAFESDPQKFQILQRNVSHNGLCDITLLNLALSDKRPLSNYIKQPIDFLKLDIEGAEALVVDEISRSDSLRLVSEMAVEFKHLQRSPTFLGRAVSALKDFDVIFDSAYPEKNEQEILIHARNRSSKSS